MYISLLCNAADSLRQKDRNYIWEKMGLGGCTRP